MLCAVASVRLRLASRDVVACCIRSFLSKAPHALELRFWNALYQDAKKILLSLVYTHTHTRASLHPTKLSHTYYRTLLLHMHMHTLFRFGQVLFTCGTRRGGVGTPIERGTTILYTGGTMHDVLYRRVICQKKKQNHTLARIMHHRKTACFTAQYHHRTNALRDRLDGLGVRSDAADHLAWMVWCVCV